MRKIHEPFSRMTETGDGYHSNEVRVKKKARQKKYNRKSSTEKAPGVGGEAPGTEEWRNQRIVMTKAGTVGEGRSGRRRPER